MIILQIRAGRFRLTLEHIDRRKRPAQRDDTKRTAADTPATVKVEVTNNVVKG